MEGQIQRQMPVPKNEIIYVFLGKHLLAITQEQFCGWLKNFVFVLAVFSGIFAGYFSHIK